MRILCLLEKYPFPANSGSRRRVLRLVSSLREGNDLKVVVVPRWQDLAQDEELRAAQRLDLFPPTTVVTPSPRKVLLKERVLWLSGRSLPFGWQSCDVSSAVAHVASVVRTFSPDVVWVASSALGAAVLPLDLEAPVVVDLQHSEKQSIDRQLRQWARGFPRTKASWRLIALTVLDRRARIRTEAAGVRRASLLTPCSELVAADLPRVSTEGRTIVRNGVDVPEEMGWEPTSGRLLFVGNLGYPPNSEAVRTLLHDFLPQMRRVIPGVELHVVGAGGAALNDLWSVENVVWHGFVDDLAPQYKSAALVVAPLDFGSGTKLKIIEAFAHGVPVVTTPTGVEGLDVSGREVAVGTSVPELVELALALLNDPGRADLQRQRARDWVERTHTWASAGDQLRRAVKELVDPSIGASS